MAFLGGAAAEEEGPGWGRFKMDLTSLDDIDLGLMLYTVIDETEQDQNRTFTVGSTSYRFASVDWFTGCIPVINRLPSSFFLLLIASAADRAVGKMDVRQATVGPYH
jgi:hypothetical protein